MRSVAIIQLLALLMSLMVDPVTHAMGLTAHHNHDTFTAHLADSYAHAEAGAGHPNDRDGNREAPVPFQDGDSHQPGHCHMALFVISAAPALHMPVPRRDPAATHLTSPVDRTLSPPTRPPLPA